MRFVRHARSGGTCTWVSRVRPVRDVAAFIKHVYREMFRVGMLALSEPRESIPFGDI